MLEAGLEASTVAVMRSRKVSMTVSRDRCLRLRRRDWRKGGGVGW